MKETNAVFNFVCKKGWIDMRGRHCDTRTLEFRGIIRKFANVLKNRTMRVFAAITGTCRASGCEHAVDLCVLSAQEETKI